jgi:hypothetical protein
MTRVSCHRPRNPRVTRSHRLWNCRKWAAIWGTPAVAAAFSARRHLPSRPREFHPEPLTDPDVILSHHPARAIARRLPPSAEIAGSSWFDPVGPRSTTMTHPLRSMGITPLRRTCRLADYAEWFREDTVFSRICRWSNDRRPASIRHSLTSYSASRSASRRSLSLKRTRLRRSLSAWCRSTHDRAAPGCSTALAQVVSSPPHATPTTNASSPAGR